MATSSDGIDFSLSSDILGPSYFRIFYAFGNVYAVAKNGNTDCVLLKSPTGVDRFRLVGHFLPNCRHTAIHVIREDSRALLVYSLVGDTPERLYTAYVNLEALRFDRVVLMNHTTLLSPKHVWEGSALPIEASHFGPEGSPVHEVRDPALLCDAGEMTLVYSTAGEQGLALAKISNYDMGGMYALTTAAGGEKRTATHLCVLFSVIILSMLQFWKVMALLGRLV